MADSPSQDLDSMPSIRREADRRRRELISGHQQVLGSSVKVEAGESPISGADDETTVLADVVPEREAVTMAVKAPKKQEFAATLESATFKLEFPATDISVSDYQLALRIPRNGFKFIPKLTENESDRQFVLTFQRASYHVIYAGGIIDFPTEDSWTLAFLIEEKHDDQDRQS